MGTHEFNEYVTIGDIEFETSGSYYPDEIINDYYDKFDENTEVPIEIEFDTVIAHVSTDDGIVSLDGKPILESLNAWNILEREVYKQLDLNPDREIDYDLDENVFDDDDLN